MEMFYAVSNSNQFVLLLKNNVKVMLVEQVDWENKYQWLIKIHKILRYII